MNLNLIEEVTIKFEKEVVSSNFNTRHAKNVLCM